MNKVILIGRIGPEPEIRYHGSGDPVTTFRVATSEKWRDKSSGEMKETTDWHRVVVFGRKNLIEHLHKGTQLMVEGKLKTKKWKNKEGQDQYTVQVEVGADGEIELLGRPGNSQGNSNTPSAEKTQTPQSSDSGPDFEDDIPF